MAVVVQCFQCNAVLELDDGFRGGVCRCSTCGALLQVPKGDPDEAAPRKARPAAPAPQTRPPRGGAAKGGGDGGGLSGGGSGGSGGALRGDAGLSSSGLRRVQQTRLVDEATSKKRDEKRPGVVPTGVPPFVEVQRNNWLMWAALGLIALIAVVVIVSVLIYMFRGEDGGPAQREARQVLGMLTTLPGPGVGVTETAEPAKAEPPLFVGIPLKGKRVILSVDAAARMGTGFDSLRRGIGHVAERLMPEQQLKVVVWGEQGLFQVPVDGFVGPGRAGLITEGLSAVTVQGTPDAAAAMTATMTLADSGDQVVFVTAQFGLPEGVAEAVLGAKKEGVEVNCVKLGGQDSPSVLEKIAQGAGGRYLFLGAGELDEATR